MIIEADTSKPCDIMTVEAAELELRNKSQDLYVTGKASIKALAKTLNRSEEQVIQWAQDGKWVQKRTTRAEALIAEADAALQCFQSEAMVPTAERHVSVATIVEEKLRIAADLIDVENGGQASITQLAQIDRALSMVTPVSSKASGLEVRTSELARQVVDRGNTRMPLVMINVPVTVSPGGQAAVAQPQVRTINVTPE